VPPRETASEVFAKESVSRHDSDVSVARGEVEAMRVVETIALPSGSYTAYGLARNSGKLASRFALASEVDEGWP
jgi:hypothetical protein